MYFRVDSKVNGEDDTYFNCVMLYPSESGKAGLVSNTMRLQMESYNEYYKTSNIVDTNFALRCFHPIKRGGSRVWQIS